MTARVAVGYHYTMRTSLEPLATWVYNAKFLCSVYDPCQAHFIFYQRKKIKLKR